MEITDYEGSIKKSINQLFDYINENVSEYSKNM